MKHKGIWIAVIVILAIALIGCSTNWFGLGKKKVTVTTPSLSTTLTSGSVS